MQKLPQVDGNNLRAKPKWQRGVIQCSILSLGIITKTRYCVFRIIDFFASIVVHKTSENILLMCWSNCCLSLIHRISHCMLRRYTQMNPCRSNPSTSNVVSMPQKQIWSRLRLFLEGISWFISGKGDFISVTVFLSFSKFNLFWSIVFFLSSPKCNLFFTFLSSIITFPVFLFRDTAGFGTGIESMSVGGISSWCVSDAAMFIFTVWFRIAVVT